MKKIFIYLLPLLVISCSGASNVVLSSMSDSAPSMDYDNSSYVFFGTEDIVVNRLEEDFIEEYSDNEKLFNYLATTLSLQMAIQMQNAQVLKDERILSRKNKSSLRT